MKKIGFLFFFSFISCLISPLFGYAKSSVVITKVELHQSNKSSKVKIRLTEPLDKIPDLMASLQTVSFSLNAVLPEKKRKHVKKNKLTDKEYVINSTNFINKVQLFPNSDGTTFEIKRQYFTPVNFVNQEDPPALIVELPREYFQKESVELKPGIEKHLIRTVNNRGPIVLHILEVDLSNKNISFKVGMPGVRADFKLAPYKIKTKETLAQIVKDQMAFAGINANYFDVKLGNPIGTLITDGTWITGPVYDRVAVGFSEDNKVFIDQVMLIGDITAYRGFRRKPKQ